MSSINSIVRGNGIVELNKSFSTTRRVIKCKQPTRHDRKNAASTDLFPSNQSASVEEGGLRRKGYFKRSESDRPLISVVTAVYNGVEYIEQAIQSVIRQSYDNVEYIIIDGGSTDGTLDIIKKYDEAVDCWISEHDQSAYDAMNKGVKLCQGEYILFLGCDDRLFDVFHEVVNYFDNKKTSYYGDVVLSKDDSVYGGKFHSLKLFVKNIPHQAIFYSKYVFDEYAFDLKYVAVADYELNLKLFSNKKHGLKYIPKAIAEYNNEDGLSSTLIDRIFSSDKPELIKKHYSFFYYITYIFLRYFFKRK